MGAIERTVEFCSVRGCSRHWSWRSAVAWLCVLALGPSGALGQASFPVSDYEPVGYLIKLGGRALEGAEVFQSRAAGAFLILASDLPAPVMVRLRESEVVTVDLMKINRNQDGSVELLPGAVLASQGGFRLTADGAGIEFAVEGQSAQLVEKPPLLGSQSIESLERHSPDYRRSANSYRPSDPIVSKLRQFSGQVEVRVFFGSWCGACKQMVPRIIKVAEELEGSRIRFDFYGLPRGIVSDPEADRLKISSVPTGVVLVEGKEVGRISGNGWKVPELAINNLLVNQSS